MPSVWHGVIGQTVTDGKRTVPPFWSTSRSAQIKVVTVGVG